MVEPLDIDESQLIDPATVPGELGEDKEIVLPAPGRKTAANPVWVAKAEGIWLNTLAKQAWLYERPIVGGKPTFRALGTTSLKYAKEERIRRIAARRTGVEPTAKKTRDSATAGDAIRLYEKADYPDKQLNQRPAPMRDSEKNNCSMLLGFWDNVRVGKITAATSDDYRTWRIRKLKRKTSGTRTVDLELTTLNNAFLYAERKEVVSHNPLANRPKYHDKKKVRHCREFMPEDADELHERAAHLFGRSQSVVLGFQYLAEAYTGLRTCEVLRWGSGKYGTFTPDQKCMRVWRCKGQHLVNPYCTVHEGLEALLVAHAKWHNHFHPASPWFFPSPKNDARPVSIDLLAHALALLPGKKVTSHGGRAFYVTVRRSHGISDSRIAHEIGHTTGGSTLASVYGGVPPNWTDGDGPKLSWLPTRRPAWELMPLNFPL